MYTKFLEAKQEVNSMTQSIEDKILKALKKENKPMRPGEIAESAKLDKEEVSKAIKKLASEGKIHSPKRCFWEAI